MNEPASSDQRREERAAQNEAVFRDANERIETRLNDLSLEEGRSPFLCECSDPSCTVIVRLTLTEYEQVREDGQCFVVTPDHSTRDGEVVRKEATFWIVRKTGPSGDLAQRTDPRR